MSKDNYDFKNSLSDPDLLYEEMKKSGFDVNLDVSSVGYKKREKKRDIDEYENAGKSFFDRATKDSKHYKKNEWKRTIEKAGEEIVKKQIKVEGNIYSNNYKNKSNKNSDRPINKPTLNIQLCKFKTYPSYRRYVFDDTIAPVTGNCHIRNIELSNILEPVSKEKWNEEIRDVFIKYLLSTRYPAAIYTLEEFSDAFFSFKGYISTQSNLWFIPFILTKEYIGVYILSKNTVDMFDNAIIDWLNNGEWDSNILLTDWIQLIENASNINNSFLHVDQIISEVHDSTSKNREDVAKFIFEKFSDENGFGYDDIVSGIVYVEEVKDAIIEIFDKVAPGYSIFNDDDKEDDEDSSDLNDDNDEAYDVTDDYIGIDDNSDNNEEGIDIKGDYSLSDDIDSMIDDAYNTIEEPKELTEEESEPIEAKVEAETSVIEEKPIDTVKEKTVTVSNSIEIEQDTDDPDSIVIKPFKKKG